MGEARAFWLTEPGVGEIRTVHVPEPRASDVVVRTLHTAVSRGTESLVFRGGVPPSQYAAMRAPFQDGDFPAPVKYGYLNVGVVEQGPPDLRDRTVFCLYPHQTRYVVPSAAVVVVPDGVPARRAVLAGTVETAVNALWDAKPLVGDRVAVVGAGMVGCSIARLLRGFPGVRVTLVDVDLTRAAVAAALGVDFTTPEGATGGCDLVVHASATSAGLQLSLDLLGPEGTVMDLSWYGDTQVTLSLGGTFHSGRLGIRASQVGAVAAARRGRRSHRDRMALALDLLHDSAFDELLTGCSSKALSCNRSSAKAIRSRCDRRPRRAAATAPTWLARMALALDLLHDSAFDELLTGCSRFDELPEVMPRLADGRLPALCHTITYDEG